MTGPGIFEFQRARDPQNQAREMEIFLRLQQESMRQLGGTRDQLLGGQAGEGTNQGVSVGPMRYAPGQFGPQSTGDINLGQAPMRGTQPTQAPTAARPEMFDGLDSMSNGELVARAGVLGVDNAEKIPADALRQIIAARRQDIRPSQDVSVLGAIGPSVALAGIGAAQGLTGAATHFVNALDAAARFMGLPEEVSFRENNKNKIGNWLSGLDEGVRANIGPEDQKWGNLFGGEGNLLAYSGIGSNIFKGVGSVIDHGADLFPAIGKLATSPMARGAIQGLGTALTLDAGTDKPWLPSAEDLSKVFDGSQPLSGRADALMGLTFGNRLVNSALGAALGGFGEALAAKYMPTQPGVRSANAKIADDAMAWHTANPTDPEDAVWHFVDENGGLGSGTTAVPRIGAGADYEVGPPGSGGPPSTPPSGPAGAPSQADGVLRDLTPEQAGTATTLVNGVPESAQPSQVASVASPPSEYIGPERQLMGPPRAEDISTLDLWRNEAVQGALNPVRFHDDPQINAQIASSYINSIRQFRSDPTRWVRSSPEEVIPQIMALKDQRANVEAKYNFLFESGDKGGASIQLSQMQDMDEQIQGLLRSADLNNKSKIPTLWETIGPERQSPATPSRDLVEQAGTIFRTPDGRPKLMFHGTHVPYAEIDPEKLASGENLFGPGFYATDNPMVAGGDPLNVSGEPGYANVRATQVATDRLQLQDQSQRLTQQIQAFEQQGPSSGLSADAYPGAKAMLESVNTKLAALPMPSPNVRPFFITGTNFFRADQPMDFEAGMQIIRSVADHPDFGGVETWPVEEVIRDWQTMHDPATQVGRIGSWLNKTGNTQLQQPNGKQLYDLLQYMGARPDITGQITDTFGTARLNNTLQSAGYDGVQYSGGQRVRTSAGSHDAVAVFDPKNIVPAYISGDVLEQHAARLGIQLQKMHEVIDSPIADQLASHSVITDADVAAATAASNPGGFHVVKGVEDMKSMMEGLMDSQFKGSYDGLIKAFRPVLHPSGRFDVLVSSLGEITDQMVADYTRTGFFPGMDVVVKKSGKLAKVVNIQGDHIKWQSEGQAKRNRTTISTFDKLDAQPNARQIFEAPDLYDKFKDGAIANVSMLKQQANQDPSTEWIEPIVYQNLSKEFEKFAAAQGIDDPGVKGALYRYFDQRYIEDVQALAQNDVDKAWAQDTAINELDSQSQDGPDLHLMASMKGFDLTTRDEGGFVLHDQLGTEKIPLENEGAVAEFLANAPSDRVPNVTPASEVPADAVPQYGDGNPSEQPSADHEDEQLIEDILAGEDLSEDDLNEAMGGSQGPPAAGGGGGAGQPPNGPPTGNAGQGGPPEPPNGGVPDRMAKRARRGALKRELDREGVYNAMHRYQRSLYTKLFSPMRVVFANLQNDLHNAGATSLKPWESFDRIISGMDVAHNETFPYLEETGAQLQRVARKKLRDGSWSRMWLMQDPVQRALYAKANKFDNGEIDAMSKLDRAIVKMHNDQGENGIHMLDRLKSFVRASRANHEAKQFGDKSYPISDYPEVGFFGEQAQSTRMRFEAIDPRRIVRQYIRSWGFSRHAGQAWQDSLDQWRSVRAVEVEGKRPFAPLADQVLDWMDFVKRGPEPGKELAVKVVNRTLRFMGVPLTHGETRRLMQGFQNSMYQALQGWRLHVIIRDSTQPLLSAPTVGYEHLGAAYKTAAKLGSTDRYNMMERAYQYGVTQHRIPRVEGTGIFEAEGPDVSSQFNAFQRGTRAVGQAVGDVVRDATPRGLRGLDLSVFGPLGLYTREGEWNRIIVGEAAYSKFGKEWQNFQLQKRIAASLGDMALMPDVDQLVKDLNADSFRPAIARGIRDQIVAGNIEGPHGAMGMYMRAIADRTQFTYGGRHAPPVIRTTGARMGYALGNFSSQSIALAKEFSSFGSPAHKLAALATIAGVTGALEYMHRKTGWNFRNWEWWQSLLFTGSPIAKSAMDTFQTANAAQQVLTQQNPGRDATDQLTSITPSNVFADFVRTYNPLQGAVYTAGGIGRALESPSPASTLAQFMITGGTRGPADSYQQIFSSPQSAPASNIPATPGIAQTDRSVAPAARLPGPNQFHGQDQTYQKMMTDMLRIQQQYKGIGTPPPAQPDSLGRGGGAF